MPCTMPIVTRLILLYYFTLSLKSLLFYTIFMTVYTIFFSLAPKHSFTHTLPV